MMSKKIQQEKERHDFLLTIKLCDICKSLHKDILIVLFLILGFSNLFLSTMVVINLYPMAFSFQILYYIWFVLIIVISLLVATNIVYWITRSYLKSKRRRN